MGCLLALPTLDDYPLLVPRIADALQYADGTHTVADVQAMLVNGQAQLWPGIESAVVTQIRQTPQKKVLNVFLAGGEMAEIRQLMPLLYAWAKAEGCTSGQFMGRKGWERTFAVKEQGWIPRWTGYAKDL